MRKRIEQSLDQMAANNVNPNTFCNSEAIKTVLELGDYVVGDHRPELDRQEYLITVDLGSELRSYHYVIDNAGSEGFVSDVTTIENFCETRKQTIEDFKKSLEALRRPVGRNL